MKQDIILNGVSIQDLKDKREAIKPAASKFISDSIEEVKGLVGKMLESKDSVEINTLAEEAYDALSSANVVSGVSGVEYFLPYYEEYGRYDNDEILSSLLEESDNKAMGSVWDNRYLANLHDLLQTMEAESRAWNTSTCY